MADNRRYSDNLTYKSRLKRKNHKNNIIRTEISQTNMAVSQNICTDRNSSRAATVNNQGVVSGTFQTTSIPVFTSQSLSAINDKKNEIQGMIYMDVDETSCNDLSGPSLYLNMESASNNSDPIASTVRGTPFSAINIRNSVHAKPLMRSYEEDRYIFYKSNESRNFANLPVHCQSDLMIPFSSFQLNNQSVPFSTINIRNTTHPQLFIKSYEEYRCDYYSNLKRRMFSNSSVHHARNRSNLTIPSFPSLQQNNQSMNNNAIPPVSIVSLTSFSTINIRTTTNTQRQWRKHCDICSKDSDNGISSNPFIQESFRVTRHESVRLSAPRLLYPTSVSEMDTSTEDLNYSFSNKCVWKQDNALNNPKQIPEDVPPLKCSVCLESYNTILKIGNHLVALNCGHVYCNLCLKTFISSKKCAQCRFKINPKKILRLYI